MVDIKMKAEVRFLAWFGVATALSFLTASNFVALLDQSLGDTFGSVFPAIPFAALLALILALRWSDLKEVLAAEGGFASQSVTRLLGLVIVGALLALRPITSQTVEASGIALVLTFYGSSLVMNPLTRRFMLPYAGVCAIGVGAPAVLQLAFGEPLATLSSDLSARMVALAGFPVSWQGTQFELVTKSGEVLTGTVTPGCSSIISVTTFLGLLALMHLDLRKDLRSTTVLAIAGVAILTLLNSIRILILLWVGYEGGAATFWGVHNWIGYALFLGFYLAALPIYSRMGRGPLGLFPGRTG
ncbi:MAG TPA: archaeosortase/exosortase family protein [Nitrososphaerales archaeon]|nr:archaeosortase/exosortase family protein [Nitrososphaerales archaeon]